jgi:hypothetical protein
MASHGFFPERGNSESGMVQLELKVGIGATGAVLTTTASDIAPAAVSVTRNSTGDYTVLLSQAYPTGSFRGMVVTHNVNSTTPADLVFQVYAVTELSKTISFKCLTGATPAAADPGSGSTLFLEPRFKYGGG